jgi:dTDP-glucose 4,6-dehydratase
LTILFPPFNDCWIKKNKKSVKEVFMTAKKVTLQDPIPFKTIVVAGAAGFVPSTLAEFYLARGVRVIGLDNFITGSPSNIKLLEKYPQFEFVECNVYDSVPDFKDLKIDAVFSLASPASPIDFQIIPLEIMRVNSEGTMKLLELAKEKKARFLEASTSEVYGDPEIHPQQESYWGNVNPIGIRSCYDESKRFAEAMTMSYFRRYKVDTRIVRIFNTYGPRMRPNDGRVIPNFINQALKNEDVTMYGEGLQTRSFCYVTDLVNAMHLVMMQTDSTPFNIGNPDEYTIRECADFIIKHLKSSSKIVSKPMPEDDPKRRRPDLTKLQAVAEYKPLVSFKEGLTLTADYFAAQESFGK